MRRHSRRGGTTSCKALFVPLSLPPLPPPPLFLCICTRTASTGAAVYISCVSCTNRLATLRTKTVPCEMRCTPWSHLHHAAPACPPFAPSPPGPTPQGAEMMRHTFTGPTDVSSATLYISAVGWAQAYVNGAHPCCVLGLLSFLLPCACVRVCVCACVVHFNVSFLLLFLASCWLKVASQRVLCCSHAHVYTVGLAVSNKQGEGDLA